MRTERSTLTRIQSAGGRTAALLILLATVVALLAAPAAQAADFSAGTEVELVDAFTLVNGAGVGDHTITLTSDITLTAPLPPLANTEASVITLAGGGFTLSGDGASTVLIVNPGVTAVIEEMTITGGAGDRGGGIWNLGDLTVRQSTVTGNEATKGAGIHSEPFEGQSASLVLEQSTIAGNTASNLGGGLFISSNSGQSTASITDSAITGNSAADLGGGLLSSGQAGQTEVTIVRTTIAGNTASLGGGVFNNGNGGAATLAISDSTLSGNTVEGGGGGLANNGNQGTATVSLANVTISGNAAKNGGGLVNSDTGGTAVLGASYVTIAANTAQFGDALFHSGATGIVLRGVILAHTADEACAGGGLLASTGYNLATDESCALGEATDVVGAPAGLEPLALNAPGTTETMALATGSPAINAVPQGEAGCGAGIASDQRGVVRPQDGACDIGAYEVAGEVIEPPPDDCTPPYAPSTEQTLNEAIACVNDAGAGVHLITLAADITLTGPTTPFSNTASDELQLDGAGFTVDGDGTGTVFTIASETAVVMRDLTITGGAGSRGAGGDSGGGIFNQGDLSLEMVTIAGNSAGSGAGLYSDGSVTVEASTFSGNVATGAGGGAIIMSAGGPATFFIDNSTFSGNSAAEGGAIAGSATAGSADIGLGYVTLADNSADSGSALFAGSGSTFTVGSSLLQAGAAGLCVRDGGTIVSVGYNVSSDTSCNLGLVSDLTATDAALEPLALNAPGTTATHALMPASPAINLIPGGANGCGDRVTTDQRGAGRPFPGNGRCDAGAYEAQFNPVPPPEQTFTAYLPVTR